MKAGDDPREDKSEDGPKYPNAPNSDETRPAPGGAGTGTPHDPTGSKTDVGEAKKD